MTSPKKKKKKNLSFSFYRSEITLTNCCTVILTFCTMSNPTVFFDINIDGAPAGRITFLLYADTTPKVSLLRATTPAQGSFCNPDPFFPHFLLLVSTHDCNIDLVSRLARTFVLCARVKRVWANRASLFITKDPSFTVLSQISCFKVVISPLVMAVVANLSMVPNSPMRTSLESTPRFLPYLFTIFFPHIRCLDNHFISILMFIISVFVYYFCRRVCCPWPMLVLTPTDLNFSSPP